MTRATATSVRRAETGSDPSSLAQREDEAAPTTLHLVWLSAVTWDFPLVGRTRLITEEWQALSQPTTFVQIPSYRTAIERMVQPLRGAPAAHVVRPWPTCPAALWPRIPESRLRRTVLRRAGALRRKLEQQLDFSRAVGLVVSPVWTPWLEALPFRAVVYDCIDNLAVMTPRPDLLPLYRRWETELIQRAHGAVASTQALAEEIRSRRRDLPITTIRNGVDAEQFRRTAHRDPRPEDLPHNPGRPIVGFVGALYDWIDWALIQDVATRLREFDFAFVGPYSGSGPPRSVTRLPNVHLLGLRPYDQIPAYIAAFDVCWVPFRQGDVAFQANPVKIYEYLSQGKPVVTTPIADIHTFEGLVNVGKTPEKLGKLLYSASISPRVQAAKRVAFALQNTWRIRATSYLDFVTSIAT